MKKLIIMAFAISALLSGCDSWVDKAETPSNTLTYDELKRPSMIATLQSNNISDGPMVAFVKTLQGEAAAQSFLALGTTVDELTEGTIPNALLYRHISSDNITPFVGHSKRSLEPFTELLCKKYRSFECCQRASRQQYEGN